MEKREPTTTLGVLVFWLYLFGLDRARVDPHSGTSRAEYHHHHLPSRSRGTDGLFAAMEFHRADPSAFAFFFCGSAVVSVRSIRGVCSSSRVVSSSTFRTTQHGGDALTVGLLLWPPPADRSRRALDDDGIWQW